MTEDPRDLPRLFLPVALMLVLTASALMSRPPLPVDETRYLSVAWEMHESGDWLVPHKNGATYAHKPPLLFWIMNALWLLTGPTGWSARLAGPAMAVVSILFTYQLGKQLWNRKDVAQAAALIQTSMMLWMVFSTLTMFDTLQTVTAQMTLLAYQDIASRGLRKRSILLASAGIGLGILAKGPVIFVHVLPVALSAPWWCSASLRIGRWYLTVAMTIVFGGIIGLSWALAAAASGGQAYAEELLWGQTANRVVESFSHKQPFWFYLLVLPIGVLPWPLFSRCTANLMSAIRDRSNRFCLAGIVGTLLVMSLVSGKQPYYLVPSIPLVALLIARTMMTNATRVERSEKYLQVAATLFAAVTPAVVNMVPQLAVTRLNNVCPTIYSVALVLVSLSVLIPVQETPIRMIRHHATASVMFLSVLVVGLGNGFWQEFDLSPMARFVRVQQEAGEAVFWYGGYHGQLNFMGRLEQPLVEGPKEVLLQWVKENPGGVVVMRAIDDIRDFSEQNQGDDQRRAAIERQLQQTGFPDQPLVVEKVLFDQPLRRGLSVGVIAAVRLRFTTDERTTETQGKQGKEASETL
ncbi:MAG: glycosyltransferase family 39 protein [Planctomycetaceae bacterium]|nr:glycosyltransferase family 39 protein [Planctomycetaceae bacterium]